MAEEGGKSFQLIRCLKKFDGKAAHYPEWKYNTRRTIGLYKPMINKLLGGTWEPEPIYEDIDDFSDVNSDSSISSSVHHSSVDDEDADVIEDDDTGTAQATTGEAGDAPESGDATGSGKSDAAIPIGDPIGDVDREFAAAKKASRRAAAALLTAKEDLEAKTSTRKAMKAKTKSTAILKAEQQLDAAKLVSALATKVYKLMKGPRAMTVLQKSPTSKPSAKKPSAKPRRRVITNQDELDAYEEADSQLFNILFLTLTGAAGYIHRGLAPVDESSGSGLQVWQALEAKYQPANENRRRHLERELEAARMLPGTDPDIFITHVWHLAEG